MIHEQNEDEEDDGDQPDMRLATLYRCLQLVKGADADVVRDMIEDLQGQNEADEEEDRLVDFELRVGGARGPARSDGRHGELVYKATVRESMRSYLADFTSNPRDTAHLPVLMGYLDGQEVFRTVGITVTKTLAAAAQSNDQQRESEMARIRLENEQEALRQQVDALRRQMDEEKERLAELRADLRSERTAAAEERARIQASLAAELQSADRQRTASLDQINSLNEQVQQHSKHIQNQIAIIDANYQRHLAEIERLKVVWWDDAKKINTASTKAIEGNQDLTTIIHEQLRRQAEGAATPPAAEESGSNIAAASFLNAIGQVIGPLVQKAMDQMGPAAGLANTAAKATGGLIKPPGL